MASEPNDTEHDVVPPEHPHDLGVAPEDAEQQLRLLCIGAGLDNAIHLSCYVFRSDGTPKNIGLREPDPHHNAFCVCAGQLAKSSMLCERWYDETARACRKVEAAPSVRVMNCPFGFSVLVAPVKYRGSVRAVLFTGNWGEVGTEGVLHSLIDQADVPQREKDALASSEAARRLTPREADTHRKKLDRVVADVSRLMGLIYARNYYLREHNLVESILAGLAAMTERTLHEACAATDRLLGSIRDQLAVRDVIFFTNTGPRDRLEACTSVGLPAGTLGDVHMVGNPRVLTREAIEFQRLSEADRRTWLLSHLARRDGRAPPRGLLELQELIPVELSASFCGILAFGPTREATQDEDQVAAHEDLRQLFLVARRHLQDGLRDMAERQEVAEMLGKFSHILRGPLMSLQGAVEVLKAQIASETLNLRALREVCDGVQNDVDDIAQQAELIEQAKATGLHERAKPTFGEGPVVASVNKVWQGMARKAKARGITLSGFETLRRLPNVEFDWNQMHVVFVNLLHNAVKYSHSNREIGLSAEETELDGAKAVRICIADFGTGVHPDEIARDIFMPNFRGSIRDEKRDIEGVGMGLAVCKDIVEGVHHGRIWAHCTEEAGEPGSYQHCLVEVFVELPVKQPKLGGG